ncbi:MAG: hypothetical protein Tsb0020_19610 [Haliangiales bacterium]
MSQDHDFSLYALLGLLFLTQLIAISHTYTLMGRLHRYVFTPDKMAGKRGQRTPHRVTEDDTEDDDTSAESPLQDVFRRYSLLTDRMADLIFQLTQVAHHPPRAAGDADDARSPLAQPPRSAGGHDAPAPTPERLQDATLASTTTAPSLAGGAAADSGETDAEARGDQVAKLSDTSRPARGSDRGRARGNER